MLPLPHMSQQKKVGAILGGIAWALLGISLARMFGGDLESQILVAVCDSTAGALVWFAFDAPRKSYTLAHAYATTRPPSIGQRLRMARFAARDSKKIP